MKPWVETSHCHTRAHCKACRNDLKWRKEVGAPDVCPFGVKLGFGLGDAVAAVATPIARLLGLDCIDKETKQLKPTSKCAERKRKLNEKAML